MGCRKGRGVSPDCGENMANSKKLRETQRGMLTQTQTSKFCQPRLAYPSFPGDQAIPVSH